MNIYYYPMAENYVLECTSDGGYYAYLSDYDQCCAYGDTADDAIEKLMDVAEDYFGDVCRMYALEDMN